MQPVMCIVVVRDYILSWHQDDSLILHLQPLYPTWVVILVAQHRAMDEDKHLKSIEPVTILEEEGGEQESVPLQVMRDEESGHPL